MMTLDEALGGVTRLCIDTSPIIYFVEAHPRYDAIVTSIFEHIDKGELVGITSVVSLTEVLVQPLLRGNTYLQHQYRNLLLNSRNFHTLPIDHEAAEVAANIRSRYRVRTPDAIQIAVALVHGCEAFVTNDGALQRVSELRVLVLDQLEQ